MSEQSGWDKFHLNRRDFLKYSLATSVVVWAGSSVAGPGMSEAEARTLFTVKRINPDVFPQSVASGDPQPGGIVVWTRLRSLSSGNRVAYEIAQDTTFRNPVLRGTARTSADKDNTVKVQLNERSELKPFTTYYYRFIYNGNASRTGRFKTLPAPDAPVDRVRFGYISCQDYTNGFYTALSYLAEEANTETDLDFVVHLGDYIYETVNEGSFQSGGPEERQIDPAKLSSDTPLEADTLSDYRFLYRTYKSDRDLQRVHERFAFITIWDDHEFANDCFGANAPDSDGKKPTENNPPNELEDPPPPDDDEVVANPDDPRRSASHRAWTEYMPVGLLDDLEASPDGGRVRYKPDVEDPVEEIQIYRSFAFGKLMELVVTDERLYRDGPPCGLDTTDRLLTTGCGDNGEEAVGRTMLGKTQLEYFIDKITESNRTWKIWGNETMFMQLKLANTFADALRARKLITDPIVLPPGYEPGAGEGVYFNLDQWDGYQDERDDKISPAFKDVENFVIITGDLHTFIAGYARLNYDEPFPPELPPPDAIGACFMGGSVTSSNLREIATFGQGGDPPAPRPVPGPGQIGIDPFEEEAQASNPHITYLNSQTHGYNVIEVTPEQLTCTMQSVSTIRSPDATWKTLAKFRVPEASNVPEPLKSQGFKVVIIQEQPPPPT